MDAVKDALFTAFAMDDYAAHTAFVTRRLLPGESVDVYLASLRRYATLFGSVTDRQLAAAFVNGLPADVSGAVRASARAEKLTLAGTLARARAVIGNEQTQAAAAAAVATSSGEGGWSQGPVPAAAAAASCSCCSGGAGGRHQRSVQTAAAAATSCSCCGCGARGPRHAQASPGGGGRRQSGRQPRPARHCWRCGDPGHLVVACPSGSGNGVGATPAPAQPPGH